MREHGRLFASEELIKRKARRRGGDVPGLAKCFRCVLEAPRARRWTKIVRDIEGIRELWDDERSSKDPGGVGSLFSREAACSMGRDPSRGDRRYYESALNRDSSSGYNDSLDKSLDTGNKKKRKKKGKKA